MISAAASHRPSILHGSVYMSTVLSQRSPLFLLEFLPLFNYILIYYCKYVLTFLNMFCKHDFNDDIYFFHGPVTF